MNYLYDVFYHLFEFAFPSGIVQEFEATFVLLSVVLTLLVIYAVIIRPIFWLIYPKFLDRNNKR